MFEAWASNKTRFPDFGPKKDINNLKIGSGDIGKKQQIQAKYCIYGLIVAISGKNQKKKLCWTPAITISKES